MRHVRQRYNSDDHKRASKLNKQREESGFMSEILGIVAEIPRKLRGDRADLLCFEEAGSNPVLIKTYLQSRALVEISGKKFGIRMVWGKPMCPLSLKEDDNKSSKNGEDCDVNTVLNLEITKGSELV